jgi:hypothetical protein
MGVVPGPDRPGPQAVRTAALVTKPAKVLDLVNRCS